MLLDVALWLDRKGVGFAGMKVCLKKQAVLAVCLPEGAGAADFKEVCDALAVYGCWDAGIGLSSMRRSCDLVVWRPADGIRHKSCVHPRSLMR